MIDEIINLAISNGLWAVLFVLLFLYQIKNSTKREKKYQDIIENLTNSFGILKTIDANVKALNKEIVKIKKFSFQKVSNNEQKI